MFWDETIIEIKKIQRHLNKEKDEEDIQRMSIGDVIVMLENSFIGTVDATERHYENAIIEFWLVVMNKNNDQQYLTPSKTS